MATLVKVRGLSRGKSVSSAGIADAAIMGRGLRLPSAIGTIYFVGGTKATVSNSVGTGIIAFTAKYAGTWANGTATAGLGIAMPTGAGTGNLGPATVTITGTSPSKHHAISFPIDSTVSTAAAIVAAFNADPVASQYMSAAVTTPGAVTAFTELQLASGANGTDTGQSLFAIANNRSTVLVDVDDPRTVRTLQRNPKQYISLGAA